MLNPSDARNKRIAITAWILTFTLYACVGCTRSVQLPVGEFREQPHESKGEVLTIVTVDANEYVAKRFEVSEAGILVAELARPPRFEEQADLPIFINWEDVESISRQEINRGATFVGVLLVGALVALSFPISASFD